MNRTKDFFASQLKLASRTRPTKKVPPMKVDNELPLSTEMVEWLEESCNKIDDHGYLSEEMSSMLVRPMDSFSMYCPTGAIVTSKFSTARIPSPVSRHRQDKTSTLQLSGALSLSAISLQDSEELEKSNMVSRPTTVNSSTNFHASGTNNNKKATKESDIATTAPKINDVITRLQIMWLQRRAQLEREDGHVDRAVNTLDEALKLHLGAEKYEDAKLGEPVVSSDPIELLHTIGDNYIEYDVTAHRMATKIQICYHRHYTYLCNASGLVQRVYRGYLARRAIWREKSLRAQCAQLIQCRFRVHLARMHALATKLKQWWKVRKEVKKYQAALFIYKMARRIQRLFRGMQGRVRANQKRLELNMTLKIQRNTRGALFMRRSRAFAIGMYHKLFFRAARRIQCLSRRVAAVQRSELQLLSELTREEERMKRERLLIANTIKIELARTRLYYKTVAGKFHLRETVNRIIAIDKFFKANEARMTKQEMLARRLAQTFELHDLDGSGKLNEEELGHMMRDLCVPMTRRKISRLAQEMDTDGSGDIDFGELLDWYCKTGDSENSHESRHFGTLAMKRMLLTRQMAMNLTGHHIQRRAELAVLRECTTWRTRDAIALFRRNEPPKYQCCQCLRPFVLFTDYYAHFDAGGRCGVLDVRAMFYDRFWLRRDWKCQRQIEKEVIRINGEDPYIKYFELMANYEDRAIQCDPHVKTMMKRHVKAARHVFTQRFNDENNLKRSSVILESLQAGGVKVMSQTLAHVLSHGINKPVPVEWIVKHDYNYDTAKKWIIESLDSAKPSLFQQATACCTNPAKVSASSVAPLHVTVLRASLVSAKSQLIALVEYRATRKRTITLSDAELESKQLGLLTTKKYFSIQNKLLRQIRLIQQALEQLDTVRVPHYCVAMVGQRVSRYLPITPVAPFDELPPQQQHSILQQLALNDAHTRARALWNARCRSDVGRVQLRRLRNELWASRRLYWHAFQEQQEPSHSHSYSYYFDANSSDVTSHVGALSRLMRWCVMNYRVPSGQWAVDSSLWRLRADLNYLHSIFVVNSSDTGAISDSQDNDDVQRANTFDNSVQLEDWPELQRLLGLFIRLDSADADSVNALLTGTQPPFVSQPLQQQQQLDMTDAELAPLLELEPLLSQQQPINAENDVNNVDNVDSVDVANVGTIGQVPPPLVEEALLVPTEEQPQPQQQQPVDDSNDQNGNIGETTGSPDGVNAAAAVAEEDPLLVPQLQLPEQPPEVVPFVKTIRTRPPGIKADVLAEWMESGGHRKYRSILRKIQLLVFNICRTLLQRYYTAHALKVMHMSARNLARVELRLLEQCSHFAAEAETLMQEEADKLEQERLQAEAAAAAAEAAAEAEKAAAEEKENGGKKSKKQDSKSKDKDKSGNGKDSNSPDKKDSKKKDGGKDKDGKDKSKSSEKEKGSKGKEKDKEKDKSKDKDKEKEKDKEKDKSKKAEAKDSKDSKKEKAADKKDAAKDGKDSKKASSKDKDKGKDKSKDKSKDKDGKSKGKKKSKASDNEDDEDEDEDDGIDDNAAAPINMSEFGALLPSNRKKNKKNKKQGDNSARQPRVVTYDEAVELFDPVEEVSTQRIQQEAERKLESEVLTLSKVKARLEDAEIQLIFRMEEDAAEKQCIRHMFLTRRGRYCLRAERVLIQQFDQMIEAYSCCVRASSVTPAKQSWRNWYKQLRDSGYRDDASIANGLLMCTDYMMRYTRPAKAARNNDGHMAEVSNALFPSEGSNNGNEGDAAPAESTAQLQQLNVKEYTMSPYTRADIGWSLILSMYVHSFDTDCSGSFDEGEVRLLLDSALCHLSERAILATFPELKQLDATTCEKVVDYLNTRVYWRRTWTDTYLANVAFELVGYHGRKCDSVSIYRRWQVVQAALLLISRSRQAARSLTAQAVSLVRTGQLLSVDDSKNEDALIVRSQTLAMRQVQMFLQTTFGRLNAQICRDKEIKPWFKSILTANRFTQQSLLEYAIKLHSPGESHLGMLNTELPHIIEYCKTVFAFRVRADRVHLITDVLQSVKHKKGLKLIRSVDLLTLLTAIFEPIRVDVNAYSEAETSVSVRQTARGTNQTSRSTPTNINTTNRLHYFSFTRFKLNFLRTHMKDAHTRMSSLARQQAVLIAMRYRGPGMRFADTNYRCSVLGLSSVMTELRYRDIHNFFAYGIVSHRDKVERRWVPREAIILLLMSKGYTLQDCYASDLPRRYVSITHRDGALAAEQVPVKAALQRAQHVFSEASQYQAAQLKIKNNSVKSNNINNSNSTNAAAPLQPQTARSGAGGSPSSRSVGNSPSNRSIATMNNNNNNNNVNGTKTATPPKTHAHSFLQYFDRIGRFVFGGVSKYVEYTRVVRAMSNYEDDVNGAGAHFMNEILTGISHCSVD